MHVTYRALTPFSHSSLQIRVSSELHSPQKMKKQTSKDNEDNRDKFNGSKSITMKKRKNNHKRLGGKGLSLHAFANAKTKNNDYNPAIIKKQREFYKNAKFVSKYKKSLKQHSESHSQPSLVARLPEDRDETGTAPKVHKKNKYNSQSLNEIYESKRQEEEKAKMEKEALLREKREAREKTEAQRKEQRAKMYKKTRSGQPVMKYRIENLLQSIQR